VSNEETAVIENFIIHRVLKKAGATEASIKTRDKVLDVSVEVEDLVKDILNVYNSKSARAYGIFNPDIETYPFSKYVKHYLSEPKVFVQFTQTSMVRLQNRIKDATLATGGYIAFIHYKTELKNYVMVVMLNDKGGTAINEATLEVNKTMHLDLSKLHFAARLNVTDWDTDASSKYLSFIKGRSTEGISKYFREFLGCDEFTESKRLTERLVQAVKDFGDAKNLSEDSKQALRKLCFEYCEKKRKDREPVLLDELANHVWDVVPSEFLEFVNDEKYQLSSGFEPHAGSLRKLYRFSGREKGLTISFDSDLLGKKVHYDKVEQTLTIKGLPQDLKRELDEIHADSPTET
jgi:nucleoid-associated protein